MTTTHTLITWSDDGVPTEKDFCVHADGTLVTVVEVSGIFGPRSPETLTVAAARERWALLVKHGWVDQSKRNGKQRTEKRAAARVA